jgi:hypothetical protein
LWSKENERRKSREEKETEDNQELTEAAHTALAQLASFCLSGCFSKTGYLGRRWT